MLSSSIDQSLPYLAPEPTKFCNSDRLTRHAYTNRPVVFSDSSRDKSKPPSLEVRLVRDGEEYQKNSEVLFELIIFWHEYKYDLRYAVYPLHCS